MTIRCEVIPSALVRELDFVFENFIVNRILDQGMWIAGGFARKIGHIILGLEKSRVDKAKNVLSYFSHDEISSYPGDIDFFSSNQNDFSYKSLSLPNSTIAPAVSKSKFANNITITASLSRFMKRHSKVIKLQLVNKFVYPTVKECLQSFDITNCKYAILKNNKHYVLMYDSEALYYDSLKELHLNKSNSPYTVNRVIKYLNKRDLVTISKEDNSMNVFRECLYNIASNCWDSRFNLTEKGQDSVKNCLIALNRKNMLTDFEISMFVGLIKHLVITKEKFDEDYGDYIYSYNVVDWATHVISMRAN